jgi:hypothetical protein
MSSTLYSSAHSHYGNATHPGLRSDALDQHAVSQRDELAQSGGLRAEEWEQAWLRNVSTERNTWQGTRRAQQILHPSHASDRPQPAYGRLGMREHPGSTHHF